MPQNILILVRSPWSYVHDKKSVSLIFLKFATWLYLAGSKLPNQMKYLVLSAPDDFKLSEAFTAYSWAMDAADTTFIRIIQSDAGHVHNKICLGTCLDVTIGTQPSFMKE